MFAYTIQASGTYYLVISGGLGQDANSNPTPGPYSLTVTSLAGGPCGTNFDGNTACPINSPATLSGRLLTDNQSDYYIFHASRGTELSVTATDTQVPTCTSANYPVSCGNVQADLYDSQGNGVGPGTGSSSPNNNITVPRSFSYTIQASGTYYLVITGGLGQDANSNPAPIPYTLQVTASPNVQWPPTAPTKPSPTPSKPKPPAPKPAKYRVPTLRDKTLAQAKSILKAHFKLGKVYRVKGSGVPAGRILRASPAGGTTQKGGTTINIWIRKQ